MIIIVDIPSLWDHRVTEKGNRFRNIRIWGLFLESPETIRAYFG